MLEVRLAMLLVEYCWHEHGHGNQRQLLTLPMAFWRRVSLAVWQRTHAFGLALR